MSTLTTTPLLTSRPVESPFGSLTAVASDAGVRAILWPADDPARAGLTGSTLRDGTSDVLDETARQLAEYFAGSRTAFELPLDLQATPFQLAAWRALAEIPYGETRTYAEQAARIGRPAAVRAVGAANGRNPVSIVLPCHRVVGGGGELRGFAGGLEVKAALLALERSTLVSGSTLVSAEAGHRPGQDELRSPCPVALGGESAVP
jgi:methylated-DNA-[protein]-cysteine S-methyltransferase